METKYGYMKPPHLMPYNGTKVLAYARLTLDTTGKGKAEWVIVKRKMSNNGTWYYDVVHASAGHVLHCDVLGWFPLPSQF